MTGGSWDEIYQHARAPWDIGGPQPAIVHLADAGELIEPILDSGCGSGEHALLAATMGLEVTGIDIAHTAIELGERPRPHRWHPARLGSPRPPARRITAAGCRQRWAWRAGPRGRRSAHRGVGARGHR